MDTDSTLVYFQRRIIAKIIIVIEDKPKNKVKTSITPSFAVLAEKVKNNKKPLTCAEAYGLLCVNAILAQSKTSDPVSVKIPAIKS